MVILKIFFYLKQFGLLRTFSYIRSHLHIRSYKNFSGSEWKNLNHKNQNEPERIVSIIGSGKYAFSTIAYFLRIYKKNFLRSVFSPGKKSAVSLCKHYNGNHVPSDWKEILNDENVKLVYISSPAETHAEYAIAFIEAGKNVYIEKPPVISESQLTLLMDSIIKSPESKVFLGYNRSSSKIFNELRSLVLNESGFISANFDMSVNKSLAIKNMSDTDSSILEHLCHFTDLILKLISLDKAFPCLITPKEKSLYEPTLEFSFSIVFADKSHVSINYKEIPNLYEGMNETIKVSKGNLIAKLLNFQKLEVNLKGKKMYKKLLFRDYGNEASIKEAFISTHENIGKGISIEHIAATSKLNLKIMEAMNNMTSTNVILDNYTPKDISFK